MLPRSLTRPAPAGVLACLTLALLILACFGRLVAAPGWLLADADRPSVDDMRRGEAPGPGNDLTRLFLPHHAAVAERVARLGRLPFWDPDGFGGRPALGNPQAGLLYPPAWIAWGWRSPAALGWLTVGHLAFAGLGTYALARASGLGRWPSVVAGSCYQAAPYLLAQTFEGHYPHVWAACWYPWAFWATQGLRRGESGRALALPPILALAFLSGHPQEWYYLVLALSAWRLADAFAALRGGDPRASLSRAATWLVAVGLGVGLAAVEILPGLAAEPWTLRSTVLGMKAASRYHWSPINLLQLLSPRALGGPADYFGHDNYWETLLSIGLVPLALALVGAIFARDRRAARGWSALVVGSVVFAAGRRLGFFALLYLAVPGMDRFRVPSRSLFLASLGAAMLAGYGVSALARGLPDLDRFRRFARRWRACAAIVGVLVVAAAASSSEGPDRATRAASPKDGRLPRLNRERERTRWVLGGANLSRDAVFWLTLGGTTLALTAASRGGPSGRKAALALGLLAGTELTAGGLGLLRVAPAERLLDPDPVGEAIAQSAPTSGPYRVRVEDEVLDSLRARTRKIETTDAYDWFQIQHAADLYEALYPARGERHDAASDPEAEIRRRDRRAVLDRMGVALVAGRPPLADTSGPVVARGILGGLPFEIRANPTALPRAYVVPRAVRADPAGRAPLESLAATDPRAAVLMAEDPLGPDGPRQPFTPASYDGRDPDRIAIRVTTVAPGLLVVADTWMPGWTAEVDGQPTPVLRGNHAQRVIPLASPGDHRIHLNYEPPGFRPGLALSGVSGLAWAVLLAIAFRRARTRRGNRGQGAFQLGRPRRTAGAAHHAPVPAAP